MSDPIDFYTTHSLITAPAARLNCLMVYLRYCLTLPGCPECDDHIFWAGHYGVQLSDGRKAEVQLRSVALQLERIGELDPRPLAEAREPDRRWSQLPGFLGHADCPVETARRAGASALWFRRYFIPDHFEDHWVCEVWNAIQRRWVLVDAQLDALQADKLGIGFNPLDVPRGEFIVGGKAWQMCRLGQADPHTLALPTARTVVCARRLVRDVAALNKMELLPWDGWA